MRCNAARISSCDRKGEWYAIASVSKRKKMLRRDEHRMPDSVRCDVLGPFVLDVRSFFILDVRSFFLDVRPFFFHVLIVQVVRGYGRHRDAVAMA